MTEDWAQGEWWDAFVHGVREDMIHKMNASAVVMSLLPPPGLRTDVKYAVELGFSILMDKPIIVVVMPGAEVPAKLRKVADRVVEVDLDTKEGEKVLTAVLSELLEGLK